MTRNIIAVIGLVAMLVVVPFASAGSTVLFEDGFEDELADNGVPQEWELDKSLTGNSKINVTTVKAYNSDQSAYLRNDPNDVTPRMRPADQPYEMNNRGAISYAVHHTGLGNATLAVKGDQLYFRLHVNVDGLYYENGTGNQLLASDAQANWTHIRIYDIDTDNNTYSVEWNVAGGSSGVKEELEMINGMSTGYEITLFQSTGGTDPNPSRSYFDNVSIKDSRGAVNGTVTNREGDTLNNVTVRAIQDGTIVKSTKTDGQGTYRIRLQNGTYQIEAGGEEYVNQSENVTIQSNEVTRDFTLLEQKQELRIDVKRHMDFGTRQPYEVYFTERNDDGVLVSETVTGEANVTSGNTSVISVDSVKHELVATNNESLTARVTITAVYESDNQTFSTSKNVTVASVSLENMKILPGATRISAMFAENEDGVNNQSVGINPMLAILVATLVGIVGSRAATSFAGLSVMTIALIVAWFAGQLGTGMMLVGVFTAAFIGLNVAANVDYGVVKS